MSKPTKEQEFQLKPKNKQKFRPSKALEIIREQMKYKLEGQITSIQETTKELADNIKYALTKLKLERYKFIVQVFIGQQKGQGVQVGGKCFWDFDTDYCASEVYQNDEIFCLVNVYGIYLY